MTHGKRTCRILKEIRHRIAEANDIELITSECRHKGDCPGTCPKCEAEVSYLERQLRTRQLMGKAVVLAGLSAGLITMSGSATATPPQNASTDTTEETINNDLIWGDIGQSDPQFPGGQSALFRFVADHLHYPNNEICAQGRVVVQFTVDSLGKVCKPRIAKSNLPEEFNEEAIRVINLLPDFSPGTSNGRPINTIYTLPIKFKIQVPDDLKPSTEKTNQPEP